MPRPLVRDTTQTGWPSSMSRPEHAIGRADRRLRVRRHEAVLETLAIQIHATGELEDHYVTHRINRTWHGAFRACGDAAGQRRVQASGYATEMTTSETLACWAISDGSAGNERQAFALADALGVRDAHHARSRAPALGCTCSASGIGRAIRDPRRRRCRARSAVAGHRDRLRAARGARHARIAPLERGSIVHSADSRSTHRYRRIRRRRRAAARSTSPART